MYQLQACHPVYYHNKAPHHGSLALVIVTQHDNLRRVSSSRRDLHFLFGCAETKVSYLPYKMTFQEVSLTAKPSGVEN